jgi:hypothetical protein
MDSGETGQKMAHEKHRGIQPEAVRKEEWENTEKVENHEDVQEKLKEHDRRVKIPVRDHSGLELFQVQRQDEHD